MLFLSQGSESALRISNGTLFHSFAADTEKVRSPSVFTALIGTYNIYIGIASIARVTIVIYNTVIISVNRLSPINTLINNRTLMNP